MSNIEGLKPCPFCGGKAQLAISDDEGNLRDEKYEKNPKSGLSFKIRHAHEENEGCPIATYDEDDATMGVYLYKSRDQALQAWNLRK
ncbi:hypothetical protein ABD91_21355 [Lysinibacillus sphaericus]|uniref:hypothetical protein n=1 Tax=Lysinibacillus sphaericus TaxID=1421 RepID=UPI0018CDEAA9|nr:hypothetical protein [Lysinibacillus sphaericus]MBG9693285.1 hypothetical protein [Lysinibacillus sphaericus]